MAKRRSLALGVRDVQLAAAGADDERRLAARLRLVPPPERADAGGEWERVRLGSVLAGHVPKVALPRDELRGEACAEPRSSSVFPVLRVQALNGQQPRFLEAIRPR